MCSRRLFCTRTLYIGALQARRSAGAVRNVVGGDLNAIAAVPDDVVGDGDVMHDVPGGPSGLVHRPNEHHLAALPAGIQTFSKLFWSMRT